jgi:serine/threonine protein kinase
MGNVASAVIELCASLVPSRSNGKDAVSHPTSVELNNASYKIQKLIGEGGYAYVYLATVPSAMHRKVALKRFVIHEPELQELFVEESRIHRNICPHDSIVTFLDSEVKQRKGVPLPEVWVSMEYCPGKTLQTLVNEYRLRNQPLPASIIKAAGRGVVAALAHMHSQSPPVAHFDVKLENLLEFFDEEAAAKEGRKTEADVVAAHAFKMCDFGSCSKLFYQCRNGQDVTIAEVELGQKMTLLYRSPESLDLWKKQRVDTKADVWALGVLFYVTLFMEYPFDEQATAIIRGITKAADAAAAASSPSQQKLNAAPNASTRPFPVTRAQISEALKPLADVVFDCMLVPDPAERSDIFTVAEKLAGFLEFAAPSRPRPGFTSAPKPRFA